MKLHLPTALRRALLAITALLSPAVVTTTIATASLAAISAPAMAEDLPLSGGTAISDSLEIDTVEPDETLDIGSIASGSNDFTLYVSAIKGSVITDRNLTITPLDVTTNMYGSVSVKENSTATITLQYIYFRIGGSSVSATNIILQGVSGYDCKITATNELHIKDSDALYLANISAGTTIIDNNITLSGSKFSTGSVTINQGAGLTLGTTTNLKGIITNNGSLRLNDSTITVDSSAFTAGSREHYSDGDNGYKTIDTTYNVLTGQAASGSATWYVDSQLASYEDGTVILAGTEDTSVYYVKNGDVTYTQTLANDTVTFSVDGGHLSLSESLKDTQSIEWKSSGSWVSLKNDAVVLKSSQLSTLGTGDFTLTATDGGTYIIDKKVGDIVELTLGTGVKLQPDYWWGTVKTAGNTTVSSDLDTTSWKNTELGGKIINAGTLVLGGNITINTSTFASEDVLTINPHYQQGNSAESMNSGFLSTDGLKIQVVSGNAADASDANWSVAGVTNGAYTFDKASGQLHVVLKDNVSTEFYINGGDTINYDKTNAAFTNANNEAATELVLNGGNLKLSTGLLNSTMKITAQQAGAVEIGDFVTLNAAQLDASAAEVTLSGYGAYNMADGANTLGSGVSVGNGWSGLVSTDGDTTALELDTLGVAGSYVDLGIDHHTLASRDQEVATNLFSSGSVSLEDKKLTLSGTNLLWNVSVGSLVISGGSVAYTTILNGLTTTGESSVSDGSFLRINGESSLGGKIVLGTGGTLELEGTITIDPTTFSPDDAVKDVSAYFIGSSKTPNATNSGFEAAYWDITIAEGGTINDYGVVWKLVGDDDATFDFDAADGTLHAYGSSLGTIFHVAQGDTITYGAGTLADFTNSAGEDATGIQLNGGTLKLETDLGTTSAGFIKAEASSNIEIGSGVTLNAAQLDVSKADVTLSGEGAYDMQGQELSGKVKLDNGVVLDANEWKGTVYTGSTAQGAALDITALGNRQSTVYVGARPILRATPAETVLESLTADGVGTTVVSGSLTLQKGDSTADALVVNGILTLGSTDTAASLKADSVNLLGLNFAHADSSLVAGKLEGATTLNVQLMDEVLGNKDAGETLTLVMLEDGFDGTLTFNGSTETERVRSEDNRKEYTLAWNEDGTVLTLTILGTETYVAEQVKSTSPNGQAGEALVTDVFLNDTPAAGGALESILNAVDAGTASDRDMAAVAGASTAALGMALSGDVERQLRAIRNRSISGAYGHDAVALNDGKGGAASMTESNRYFAWVNAEGNRAEQNADGCAAGYTLSSWGGTLGAGMQVNNQLTLGLALTAMYGDLQSDGPDGLDGDMDTAYLSAFARYESGKWSHAFIGTVGTMEADYKRTAMGYSTDGDTDGTAFGLMYEVSREFELSNRSKLSPVFNIAYRHTAVDSYSESGTDAALNVGEQSLDTVTVGLGARYAAVLGQQTLNRACAFEARALAKYDLGDRQSSTSTGFIDHATRVGIESAELGAFGVELGAGISVPVGSGSIFADGSVELRSDYTNFNAAVGYRIQF